MQYSRFATDTRPWCVWDWDLKNQTDTFLTTFDATYFEYLVNLHLDRLEGDDSRHAATAIRMTYCHAMETLFALLGATVQAPDCVQGWIQRYQQQDLHQLVSKIDKQLEVFSKVLVRPLTWHSLAQATLRCLSLSDKDKERRIKDGFARFWSRLAHEFLSDEIRAEYNSLKHGFRIGSGGSWLAGGEEEAPGVACPPDKMQVVGGSEFGSTFFEPTELCKRNIRLVRRAVNWDPYALCGRVRLISMSLRNLTSFLRIGHGADASGVQFVWPVALDDFDEVWQGPSLRTSSFSSVIELNDIQPQTADDILSAYEEM